MCFEISECTVSTGSPRASATRGACSSALATEMCGSRPDADAVTASTGTSASAPSLLKSRYAASPARCRRSTPAPDCRRTEHWVAVASVLSTRKQFGPWRVR